MKQLSPYYVAHSVISLIPNNNFWKDWQDVLCPEIFPPHERCFVEAMLKVRREGGNYADVLQQFSTNGTSKLVESILDFMDEPSTALNYAITGMRDISNDPAPEQVEPRTHGWKLRTIDENSVYRPDFLIGRHIIKGHSHIFYGSYGSLKTKLMEDLIICAAGGENWLAADDEENVKSIIVDKPVKALFLDFDNGADEIGGELAACYRGHNKPNTAMHNLHYISMPKHPSFKAIDKEAIEYLRTILMQEDYEILAIDNARRASGVRDENSSEMADAIANIHDLGHETGVATLMTMNTGKVESRSVRGNSGVLDNVDCIFKITRESGIDRILVECDKFRGKKPAPFSAAFMYESMEDDEAVLKSFRMVGISNVAIEKPSSKGDATPSDSHTKALNWLLNDGGVASIIGKTVREARDYGATCCNAGETSISNAIRALKNEKVLTTDENGKIALGSKPAIDVNVGVVKAKLTELRKTKKQL